MLRELFQAQEGAKAFPYDRRLTDAGGPLFTAGGPAAYNDYNGFNSQPRVATPLSQRHAATHMQTYGGAEAIDWLSNAVNFTATSASSVSYHFEDNGKVLPVRNDPQDDTQNSLAPAPLIKLFSEPNPYMDWEDLCELTLIDFLLVGNAYWVKWGLTTDDKPVALYRMAPQCVKIVPGQFGPDQYLYRLPGAKDDVPFTPEQVIHFKRVNPNDAYYGLGIVQAGARAMDMELELTKSMASYYEKRTLPAGVVQTERRVPKDVFNKLKQQLRSFYSGSDNSGQLMVLEAGLKFESISPSAADALFQQMGMWSRDRIFAMFHLNKGLLGMEDQGRSQPNIADWQLLFDRKTMIPLTNRFGRVISRGLTQPGWGLDFKFEYEETQQPDDIIKRATLLAALPGVKVKELRTAANLPPSTGDKEIDETVLNMPGDNMDANGAGGTADRNLPTESGRPPKGENTLAFGNGKVPPGRAGGSSARRPANKKSFGTVDEMLAHLETKIEILETKALAPAAHVHVGKLGDPVVPPLDTLHGKRTTQIDALVAEVEDQLGRAATTLERGLLDAAEGKAGDTIYKRVKESAAWNVFRDKVTSILEDASQTALGLANVHHAANGLDAADIDYDVAAREVVYRPEGLTGILKTIKDRIIGRVLKAQQKNAAQSDVEKEIRSAISEWQGGSAGAIALDTASFAYNEGTLQVAEANGAADVLVSDGLDFDKPCIDANGETWTISKARKNMSEHSRCRRGFVPLAAVAS